MTGREAAAFCANWAVNRKSELQGGVTKPTKAKFFAFARTMLSQPLGFYGKEIHKTNCDFFNQF